MGRWVIFLVIFSLCISISYAATIHGSTYDLSLNKVQAIIEINSTPVQRIVATEGSYNLTIPKGQYHIDAVAFIQGVKYVSSENITISEEGIFVIDFFLYPEFTDTDYGEMGFEPLYPEEKTERNVWLMVAGIFLFAFGSIIFILKKNIALLKKEVRAEIDIIDNELGKVVSILSDNGGRMSQKDLRRDLPVSEAKVSMMIAELEAMGKIKKIKKGRGNILVLIKDKN